MIIKAFGETLGCATLKENCEDFIVYEKLSFEPCGHGDHLFLYIEKINENTEFVAKKLARFFKVNFKYVNSAGLKDKRAITRQWFSIKLNPKVKFNVEDFNEPNIKIIKFTRNDKKLKKGSILQNDFIIRLKNIEALSNDLENRLSNICEKGFPNFFGPQRFGTNGENVDKAIAIIKGDLVEKNKFLRSIYISSLRSFLFNKVLEHRVKHCLWDKYLDGDLMILDGSNSYFKPENLNDEEVLTINQRLKELDIHPSGPLPGAGVVETFAKCFELEDNILNNYNNEIKGLAKNNLKHARRALRAKVTNLRFEFLKNELILQFSLGKGCYATSMLAQVFDVRELDENIS